MVAPAESLVVAPGQARLTVQTVFNESTVTSAAASSPMKLLTPVARGPSVWAYTSNFGGGLVAGDQTRLDLLIGNGACCFVGTQASTKVYRNPALRPCGHITHATLESKSVLIFTPDPVQAFANSSYTQRQEFHLARDAGLVLLDWFTSGRAARGERWAFDRLQSRNEVWCANEPLAPAAQPNCSQSVSNPTGELLFIDSLHLDARASLTSPHVVGRFNCFAMLLLMGGPVQEFAANLLAIVNARPVERQAALITSASPVRDGALLRIAGESVEQVGHELHRHLQPLATLLGDDPWARKW